MFKANNNRSSLRIRSIYQIVQIYKISHAIFRKAIDIYSRHHKPTPQTRDRIDRMEKIDNLLREAAQAFEAIPFDVKENRSQHISRALGYAFEARVNFFFLGFPAPDISSMHPRVPIEFWIVQEIVNCVATFFSDVFKKSHRITDREEHLLWNLEFMLSAAGDTTVFICSTANRAREIFSRCKNAEKARTIAETLVPFIPSKHA